MNGCCAGKELGSRKKKGDKFAQLKASEQAKRVAKEGGKAVATALGNEPVSAGRGVEAAVESAGASDDSPVKQQVKKGIQVRKPCFPFSGLDVTPKYLQDAGMGNSSKIA